jgi:hypothetical protein
MSAPKICIWTLAKSTFFISTHCSTRRQFGGDLSILLHFDALRGAVTLSGDEDSFFSLNFSIKHVFLWMWMGLGLTRMMALFLV